MISFVEGVIIVGIFVSLILNVLILAVLSMTSVKFEINEDKKFKSYSDIGDSKSLYDYLQDWDGKIRIRKRTDRHFKHQNCRKNLRKTKRNSNV